MKRALLITLLLALVFNIQAQKAQLKVVKFYQDPRDTYAVSNPKEDANGELCGLILLGFVMPEANFDGNTISTEYQNGQWRVYMPKGSNKLVINAKGYAPLYIDFDDYKIDFHQ